MRYFGISLCIVGVLTTSAAVLGFFMNHTGLSIGGFVLGIGIGATGVMAFLTDFMTRIFIRSSSFIIRSDFFRLRLEIHGKIEALQQ